MRSRTLNQVQLIGNIIRKPDLNQTSKGNSVCNFYLITDREWTTKAGERRSESTKHNCLAWNRLAEICYELFEQGSLVYVEGRIIQRKSFNKPNTEELETVILVEDMILLT